MHQDSALASCCKEAFPAVCSSSGSSADKLRNLSWGWWVGAMAGFYTLTLQELCWLWLFLRPSLPLSVSPSPFLNHPYLPISPMSLVSFSPPWCTPLSSSFAFPLLLNAPSGGFGYTGMQSGSHSQFSYSLSQGTRARNPSSDVSEALYNLDRVLQGK